MGENSKQSVYSTCNVSGMQNHLFTLCRASLKAELPETHLDLHLVIWKRGGDNIGVWQAVRSQESSSKVCVSTGTKHCDHQCERQTDRQKWSR